MMGCFKGRPELDIQLSNTERNSVSLFSHVRKYLNIMLNLKLNLFGYKFFLFFHEAAQINVWLRNEGIFFRKIESKSK